MKKIDELIELDDDQNDIIDKMYQLYVKAQLAGICFAVNDNANLVAYNGLGVDDCDSDPFNDEERNVDYECADMGRMREVFPVWNNESLYLRRK